MLGGDRESLTICAVSTPIGYGGLSVIRISGPQASDILKKVFHRLPEHLETHRAYFGAILELQSREKIDQAVALYFEEGKSYTGEETFEISFHGNPILCDRIMAQLIEAGGFVAEPGEFTYRAFMNNRIDLVQAEGVLSLIESRSQKAAQLALRQLEGGLSIKLQAIESQLTWCLAHIEAGIDFSTEGLESAPQQILIEKLSHCLIEVEKLVESYRTGKKIHEGIRVALVGRPNVGKSSLLNLILGYERAIVTPTPGTTRDIIEADIVFEGQRIVFQDTAGLRDETQDEIEKLGMAKSKSAAADADVVFFVIDSEVGFSDEDQKWFTGLELKKVLFLANKKDRISRDQEASILKNVHLKGLSNSNGTRFVSAFDKEDRQALLKAVKESQLGGVSSENEVLLSQSRHYENLISAQALLSHSIENLQENLGPEFVSLDLRQALIELQNTLGTRFDDQIMDRVFKEFCIGK